jgi:hypothetical protein
MLPGYCTVTFCHPVSRIRLDINFVFQYAISTHLNRHSAVITTGRKVGGHPILIIPYGIREACSEHDQVYRAPARSLRVEYNILSNIR